MGCLFELCGVFVFVVCVGRCFLFEVGIFVCYWWFFFVSVLGWFVFGVVRDWVFCGFLVEFFFFFFGVMVVVYILWFGLLFVVGVLGVVCLGVGVFWFLLGRLVVWLWLCFFGCVLRFFFVCFLLFFVFG